MAGALPKSGIGGHPKYQDFALFRPFLGQVRFLSSNHAEAMG
jgi:hypothetical protein